MLIDDFLPDWDFREIHSIGVRAASDIVYDTTQQLDLGTSRVVHWLLRARGLARPAARLSDIERAGFRKLGEVPGREMVFGLIGKFWLRSGGLVRFEPTEFSGFATPGFAKAAWNFTVTTIERGSVVSTETRVLCTDRASRRKFGAYWLVVRPFSGWIRREALRAVRRRAEQR